MSSESRSRPIAAQRVVLALIACLLGITPRSSAQQPCVPEVIGSVGGHAFGVEVVDDRAYVANSFGGLLIVDVADESNPVILGEVLTPGFPRDVAVAGDLAYVADLDALQIVDVHDPANPVLMGSVAVSGPAQGVAVSGGTACVASSSLHIVDVSDPATPSLVASLDSFGAHAVAISGDFAFVAADGLQVVDISNPATPTVVASVDPGGNTTKDIVVSGDIAYITRGDLGLAAVDVSDPTTPVILDAVTMPVAGLTVGVAVSGDFAYVADAHEGLHIVEISDPTNIVVVATIGVPYDALRAVAVSGDVAFVTDAGIMVSKLLCIDVSAPASPVIVGGIGTPADSRAVELIGDTAYIADGLSGLHVVDVSDPTRPIGLGVVETPGVAEHLVVSDDTAYVGDESTLHIVDVSDPALSLIVGSIGGLGVIADMDIAGPLVFVAVGSTGVHVIDTTDPTSPTIVATWPGLAWSVVVDGATAYVGTENQVKILEISDPAAPAFIASFALEGVNICCIPGPGGGCSDPECVTLVCSFLPFCCDTQWDNQCVAYAQFVCDVDCSNPYPPNPLTMAINEGALYLGIKSFDQPWNGSMQIVDVSNPASPAPLGAIALDAEDISFSGSLAFVATALYHCVHVVDIEDPAAPSLIGSVDGVNPYAVAAADDVIYVGYKQAGLRVLDVASCRTECASDVNGDGVVDVTDLISVVLAWGSDDSAADVNTDGIVDVQDLVEVIMAWGTCG